MAVSDDVIKDQVLIDDWLEADEDRIAHCVKNSLELHKNSRSQEKLHWRISVVIANNYVDNLKEEVEKGVREKIAQGWLPAKPPLGYKNIGKEGHIIQIPEEEVAPLIRKMFELYLDPNHSISIVTSEMKRLGLRTRYGRPLVASHITKMLKHEFYVGRLPWNGQVYPGNQEPLITEDIFTAVQQKMASKNTPKYSKHNPLFKGMFRCRECWGTITWERHKDGTGIAMATGVTQRKSGSRKGILRNIYPLTSMLYLPPPPLSCNGLRKLYERSTELIWRRTTQLSGSLK